MADDVTVGADTQNQAAELGDTTESQNVAGTDTQGQPAEDGGENQDTAKEGMQPHQTTFEERIKQIEARKNAEIAAIQNRFDELEQQLQSKVPEFYELDYERINAHLASQADKIENLRASGRFLEAQQVQREIDKLLADVDANEAKQREWQEKSRQRQQEQQTTEYLNAQLANAAKLVRDHYQISPEVWNNAERWFSEQRQADPLLDAQYRETVRMQGPVNALKWAKDYVEANMGKAAEAEKQQRVNAAAAQVGSTTSTDNEAADGINTWSDLMAKDSSYINKFYTEHPKRFETLKSKHFR